MHIYVSIARSLEILNPWSLEKMKRAIVKMRILLVGLGTFIYKYLLDISYCIWSITCRYCIWWPKSP
jgi:hypothetical protein